MRRRTRRAALACAGLAAVSLWTVSLGGSEAAAHGEARQDVRTVVVGADPPMPGVSIRVVTTTSTAIELVDRGPRKVEILSPRGEPFLRIGPDGVEADVNSATWYASGNPDGVVNAPREARIGGPPRWERIARTPGWTWFDHRLHPTRMEPPPELRQEDERRKLGDWTIPVRYGGRRASIRGYLEYRPVRGVIVPSLANAQPAAGVVAAVLPGRVPGMFLDASSTRKTVVVLGAREEPFLRFTPRGVYANGRSPTHHTDRRLQGQAVPGEADPRVRPRWLRVAEGPRYRWLELRARYPAEEPPAAVVNARRRRILTTWEVPLEVGGRRADLRGTTSWVPTATPGGPAGDSEQGAQRGYALPIALLAVLTVIAVVALVAVRRRSPKRRASAERRPGTPAG